VWRLQFRLCYERYHSVMNHKSSRSKGISLIPCRNVHADGNAYVWGAAADGQNGGASLELLSRPARVVIYANDLHTVLLYVFVCHWVMAECLRPYLCKGGGKGQLSFHRHAAFRSGHQRRCAVHMGLEPVWSTWLRQQR